jgi:uncharacterized protein (TIGR03086 family)
MLPSEPAERHRVVAGRFAAIAATAGTDTGAWSNPAPVEGWAARDVVRHLTDWFPAFLEGGTGIVLPPHVSVDDDPLRAWNEQAAAVQGILDDPSSADRMLVNRHLGEIPLPGAIDQFYTADVFMHTWDLATALRQDASLDQDFCAVLVDGMEPIEEVMRSSGQYGERVPVPAGSDAQTRLLGFIGRDPFWTPPAA